MQFVIFFRLRVQLQPTLSSLHSLVQQTMKWDLIYLIKLLLNHYKCMYNVFSVMYSYAYVISGVNYVENCIGHFICYCYFMCRIINVKLHK